MCCGAGGTYTFCLSFALAGWGSGVVLSTWKACLTPGKADLMELGDREGAEGLRTPRREDQGPSHTPFTHRPPGTKEWTVTGIGGGWTAVTETQKSGA